MSARPAMLWTALAAGLVAWPAGGTLAEDDLAAQAAAPGSYVMLVDGDGLPIVLQYRIGDGALVVFHGRPVMVDPEFNGILMVDRGFLPTRAVNAALLIGRAFHYLGEPPPPEADAPVEIAVESYTSGYVQPPRLDESYTMTFHWLGEETRAFPAGTVNARIYEADHLVNVRETSSPVPDPATRRRVVLPDLGMDVDAETWAEVADIRVGVVAASTELAAITWLMADIPETMRACVTAVVALPGYAPYNAAIGALERRSLALMERAWTDLLEYGLVDYHAINGQYGIGDRLRGCAGV